jgi:hypothetical protein
VDAKTEYARRLEDRLRIVAAKERLHRRAGTYKLATIALGLVLAWLSLHNDFFSPFWLIAPAVLYAGLAIRHEVILRGRTLAQRAADFYVRGIARIEDRWAGTGDAGERYRNPEHVYADDLDLFGRASLFELLCTARTPMGKDRLAGWLLKPSVAETILERQNFVAELREKLDLREMLATIGEELGARLQPESLIRWAESEPRLKNSALWWLAGVFSVAILATIIYGFVALVAWPFFAVLALELVFWRMLNKTAAEVANGIESNAEGLLLFAAVLKRFERERYQSARLRDLASALHGEKKNPPSRAVRHLVQIVYWVDARTSLLAHLSNLPFLYNIHLGFAAESWRRHWGKHLRAWVNAVAEMEALLAVGGYSYEHPEDPFPEFAAEPGAILRGEELGHPLIPVAQCVRNSVHLGKETCLLMVSGSNMSGKSTLLRAVGINTVLAMAGAPIRGKSLRLTPLALGTSIRTTDSLQEGRSAFFAEILRIRQVFQMLEGRDKLLFLFDELLEGTNSKDRRIGADGLMRAFVDRGAIGIVTTHDLALTEITESLDGKARNAHFQDYVENGRMRFDYKLREGVVEKSNALELMRLVGLHV